MKTLVNRFMITIGLMIGFLAMTANADTTNTFKAKLRPGVHVSIKAVVMQNPDADTAGKTVLMVHGLLHTGNGFRPLGQSIFANTPAGGKVEKIILLNMPNRGDSGLPYGRPEVLYGSLDLNDYATIVIKALEYFEGENLSPSIIIGHSMGGLVVQLAQEQLLSQGSSLKQEFKVNKVVLLSSSSPGTIEDPFLENGTGLYLLSLYTVQDPQRGSIASIDAGSFLNFFFTPDLQGSFVPGTPSPTDVTSLGYKADEAYEAALQTLGTRNLRPVVRASAFATANGTDGTELRVVVGQYDPFSIDPNTGDQTQQKELYKFLTGTTTLDGFQIITGLEVHDGFIANPATIASALGL